MSQDSPSLAAKEFESSGFATGSAPMGGRTGPTNHPALRQAVGSEDWHDSSGADVVAGTRTPRHTTQRSGL